MLEIFTSQSCCSQSQRSTKATLNLFTCNLLRWIFPAEYVVLPSLQAVLYLNAGKRAGRAKGYLRRTELSS